MARVRISSLLRDQLKELKSDQLLVDFSNWKDGDEDGHFSFGRDSRAIGGKSLAHAHMVPINSPSDLLLWEKCWTRYSPRKSDRYIFYADGGLVHGFLLIAMIDDPGAHEIWDINRRSDVAELELVAEEFCNSGIVP